MGNYVDKKIIISCPEKVKIKGQVYKFTGRIDWSKHYPIPVYKKDE